MPSQFELLATIMKFDTYWELDDLEPARELMHMILRTCHDYNDPRFQATDLADALGNLIGAWMAAVTYPEDEGDIVTDWGEWHGQMELPKVDAATVTPIKKPESGIA